MNCQRVVRNPSGNRIPANYTNTHYKSLVFTTPREIQIGGNTKRRVIIKPPPIILVSLTTKVTVSVTTIFNGNFGRVFGNLYGKMIRYTFCNWRFNSCGLFFSGLLTFSFDSPFFYAFFNVYVSGGVFFFAFCFGSVRNSDFVFGFNFAFRFGSGFGG